ncbi:platelet binding protein GspB-like isoform X3 [Periplaneta americana]|uniref:platelet binding protein GspB-like isoform X3 n=1 Tax=Periplaneta americana TaxID=6978 RepID=UPI0037E8C00F
MGCTLSLQYRKREERSSDTCSFLGWGHSPPSSSVRRSSSAAKRIRAASRSGACACTVSGDLEAVSQRLVQLSKEQGSTDNISVIVVFLREPAQLAMDSNAGLLYKQNGTAAPSATDLYFLNRQDDDDDDLGPETDVDAVDDVLLSPAIAASKAAALSNNNPFSLEADLELQRQQLKDFDPESEPRHDTPTPPADQVAGEPGVAALVPESDNVAESGEDSEDEWNYYRVEPSADESQQSTQPICEKSVQLQLEDESNMESQLNPDAAEFVPSPTQLMPSMEEVLLAQSPRKGVPMEDISVPSQIEFQHEVSQRPSELEVTDKLPDLISSGLDDTTNPFVHNGGSYSDFLEDVERAQKSVLDESESSSTKAEFGDDSTVSFLTTGSELQKTVTESVSSLSAVEKSLAEQDLLGAEFTSGVSKSNNGSTCDENELSEFNESEMLVSKSVEENVLHKDSTVFINTEGTIPVCFELQKELIPEMELQPERVQLESEGTSSFEQDESGSPVGKKSEEPALSFQEKSAVNQLFSEDVPLVGLGTATSTPERAPMEQELLLSPEEDEEIKLCPDAAGTLSPDLNEASLLQQCPEPTAASKASLLDFSVSHKVNLEPFTCEKLADNIEVMGGKKEGPTFDMLTDECTMKEQEMSVTQTPPPTPAHMSDEEPIRIPPLSSPSLPSPTQLSIYEQIHPQTEASLAQQISPSTLIPLPEQASAPILASVSEEAPLPTLIPASEKALSPTLAPAFEEDPLLFLAPASEEAPLPTLAPASEEAPLPTLAPASEEAPLPTLAPASEEAPLPTLAPASEEALSSTLPPEPEETALLTLAHATEEALLPTLSPAPEETALLTLALASEETLLPTLLPASKEALSPTLAPAFEEISSATLAPVSEEIPPLAPVSEEIPTLAPVSEQLPSLAPLSEQIPSLASFSEQTPLPTFASASESVPSSTPVSEPAATCTSASEGLMKAPSDSAVLAAAVLAPVAIVPAVKAVSSEKKTSAKKPAPAKDKKVPVTAEKPKTASQKATAVTKTVQKSTPTSPTKPASSTIRSSTPKKPSSAAAAAASKPPTKSSPLTSKPGVSPSKPPASKTVASPRPRPAATGTAKPGSLSNGDVAKSAATKKPAATATRPPARPTTAPAGPKQVSSSVASRTTAVLATAQRPKPGAVNGTAAKTRATGTVATAAARNKVAAARDTKLATDKQVKETANKHILSARTTTVTATRRVAGSVTRTTVTATGTVKATTATSKVGSKKTTTSTGVARTTTTTTTKTTKTAASVNNESAVQVAD